VFVLSFTLLQVLGFLGIIPLQVLGPLIDIAVLVLLLVIGLVIIIALAKVLLFVLPAAIIAIVVWFLTGSIFWAGVAFLVIALISLVMRR
jgi:hypothetical protein